MKRLPECKQCGGELQPLGYLGKLMWARCKACGWDDPVEVIEEDEDAIQDDGE